MLESANNSDIRINNRKRLTNLLFRSGQMTKQELASKLGISLPTVTTILKELMAQGLVEEGTILDSTGGRKAQCHMPVVNAKYSLGVDASADELRIVLLNLGSEIVASVVYPEKLEYTDEYWIRVNEKIKKLVDETGIDDSKILDVGITLGESMRDGVVISRRDKTEIPDLEHVAELFDFRVTFRNSAKMAALAQIWSLYKRDNFVFVKIGNHVQGAMVYQGQIVDFPMINGEFGQIRGKKCKDGSYQTLEEKIGAQVLLQRANAESFEDFQEKVREKDEHILTILDEYLEEVAIFLYDIHCIFGWEVVISGRMSPILRENKHKIDCKIQALNVFEQEISSVFSISELGAMSAVVGAALLPIDAYFSK